MMVIVEIKLKNDMEMKIINYQIKVCIKMKLVVLQYHNSGIHKEFIFRTVVIRFFYKKKVRETSLFQFKYNPSSAYRIEEWNNDGPNVKNFAVSGSDNTWQIDEFDNDGIYTSTKG